ncbi:hypothetical protein [Chryseobacterium culicis]|uniref:hypothetical protein n=1 Tax=Chryseobacterium culicis TaxID=680127 RepID=UPI00187359CE|nr:hypothetical protein [Chryseobacterium culicis]MBE4949915.1 hypothetical protein [Chryseobacterium culicis]
MTINGLENNYYLTQNDIWVKINGFTEVVSKVVLEFKNISTGQILKEFECSASPNNDCFFNVSFPIRALMPEPDHVVVNSLQNFEIKVTAKFKNPATLDETITLTKYFIRGGRNKSGVNEWYLNDGDYLVDNYFITGGLNWNISNSVLRISGGNLLPDGNYPKLATQENTKKCDGILVKYLNSLGSYQHFYFDRYEIKNKTKASKTVNRISTRLRNDNFQNIGYDETRTLTLFSYTEKKLQPNFEDMIRSIHILFFDENGNDSASEWHLIKLDDNSSVFNNYENVYENKAEFTLPNYRTITV